jgi:hypothetical protein
MRAYYLEDSLTDEELADVRDMMQMPIEQVRIPHVLPAPDERGAHNDRPLMDEQAATRPLKAAGILRDHGARVLLVMPKDMHWYTAFAEAVHTITGYFPYLIQTADHRDSIGNKGGLRIIDMHGMMGGR